ncbi:hypothetical protein HMPREF1624_03287 [Sporothrix schenckii ATCC 58251]|uniref:Uncharacterized protein n=1 Tax=Sporothrix schenckii (strain ATCC 58251 / de Perez 2211183) TaxID=1391915 RepID=U7PYZ5_SPOS1|nr:hypothetical protein HMPREF1624_03287 [Sporothrix schenckii ATCC 58251]
MLLVGRGARERTKNVNLERDFEDPNRAIPGHIVPEGKEAPSFTELETGKGAPSAQTIG